VEIPYKVFVDSNALLPVTDFTGARRGRAPLSPVSGLSWSLGLSLRFEPVFKWARLSPFLFKPVPPPMVAMRSSRPDSADRGASKIPLDDGRYATRDRSTTSARTPMSRGDAFGFDDLPTAHRA